MLAHWEIKDEQVHLIVRDNAANMVKAMTDAAFPDRSFESAAKDK